MESLAPFFVVVYLVLGYNWQCSGFTSGSVLKDNSRQGLGNHM